MICNKILDKWKKKDDITQDWEFSSRLYRLGKRREKETICKAVKLLRIDFFFSYLYPIAFMKEIES